MILTQQKSWGNLTEFEYTIPEDEDVIIENTHLRFTTKDAMHVCVAFMALMKYIVMIKGKGTDTEFKTRLLNHSALIQILDEFQNRRNSSNCLNIAFTYSRICSLVNDMLAA